MWNNKKKAITFSFDDGVTQDVRLIELLDKYNLKATFNLNSQRFGLKGTIVRNGKTVRCDTINAEDIKTVYKKHEVAVHTLTHPNLTALDEKEIIRQVEEDRLNLSYLCGYEVIGMAYPCGGVNNDERVAKIIKENTGVKYARTITSTYQFNRQKEIYRFNPSVYYIEKNFENVVDSFLNSQKDTPQLLYIWGHAYELDAEYLSWEYFESICKKLSNKTEIFYGTNRDVIL